MKKLFFPAAIAAITLISCRKQPGSVWVPPVESATKTIHFSLAQAKDYTGSQYDGVEASLQLKVARISKKDGSMLNLWDSMITRQSIRAYPTAQQPFRFSKQFASINDNDEYVSVSFWIGYRNNQNQQHGVG
ncbi:MAG TPA: hypothetical protein PKD90_02480, partial [Phnomibacter sp.]|nr:hypothetical protein [Phnomibacter sp.]